MAKRFDMTAAQRAIRLKALDVLEKRKAYKMLHARQVTRRNRQKTLTELNKWGNEFDIHKLPEKALRLPDRTFPVRLYSKMDNDLWKLRELRGWFQPRGDSSHEDDNCPAVNTGYMVTTTPTMPRGLHATLPSSKTKPDHNLTANFAVHPVAEHRLDTIATKYMVSKNAVRQNHDARAVPFLTREQRNRPTTTIPLRASVDFEASRYLLPSRRAPNETPLPSLVRGQP